MLDVWEPIGGGPWRQLVTIGDNFLVTQQKILENVTNFQQLSPNFLLMIRLILLRFYPISSFTLFLYVSGTMMCGILCHKKSLLCHYYRILWEIGTTINMSLKHVKI